MKRLTTLAGIAALALVGWIGALSQPSVAHADPADVVLMNQSICFPLLIGSLGAIPALNTCGFPQILDYNHPAGSGDTSLMQAANGLGNNNGKIEASDFAGAANFTGGQIHQQDGAVPGNINYLDVIAFVHSDAPVTFHTDAGTFLESGSQTWTCGAADDPDCGAPPLLAPPLGQDHVVVGDLVCSSTTCPTLGTQSLTVEQGGIVFPVTFTVVGEPRTVTFFTLETALQAGVPSDANAMVPGSVPPAPACPFSASLPFIQKALGEAEKTVLVARALDINGTAIAGAWINWSVDDAQHTGAPVTFDGQGILAQPVTPTLNLGGFGYGAPNILCAPASATAGSVTVTARMTRIAEGAVPVDPDADVGSPASALGFADITFDVHAIPAKLTLTAAPASIPCDGTATSSVSATLADANGIPAISGTAVHFDVQVLGTANPIDTTTNDKGVASSTITPLSSDARGVPATVSVTVGGVVQPNLTQSILVQCSGGVAPAAGGGGGPAPSGGAGGGAAPSGAITGPNTGSGGIAGGAHQLSWWPGVGLLMAAVMLAMARLPVWRKQRRPD